MFLGFAFWGRYAPGVEGATPLPFRGKQKRAPLQRALFERFRGKPPECRALDFPRMPHCPVILLLSDASLSRAGLACGPANQLIKGIDGAWWSLGEFLRAVGITERTKVQEHRHASAGLLAMDEGSTDEGVCKSVGAIGRVGDDVLGKRAVGFQEVLSAVAIASVDEVGGNHFVSCLEKHLRDSAVATRGLPNTPLEGLDRQEGSDCLGRGWVEVVRDTSWVAEIQVRNFCFCRVFSYNLWVHRMMMKK